MPVSEIPYRYQINFDDGDQFVILLILIIFYTTVLKVTY